MRRWLESFEEFAIEVILERRYGKRAAVLRWLLHLLSFLYRGIVQARLHLYRKRVFRERPLGCLVVSIGNLTVGGTGKTPVVEKFARALQAGGRRVAILSRGYKSVKPPLRRRLLARLTGRGAANPPRIVSDGRTVLLDSRTAGDEPYMLAMNLKGVIVLVDKDRVKSGLHAIRHMGVDTLLLDDGLQYLRLKHRLDIVLVDRTAPFGNEYMLPRGTLREPPRNLRRASYIFITKCNGEDDEDLIRRIRKYNRTAEIIRCAHKPLHLENINTGERQPLSFLERLDVGSLCGIAVPESFDNALRGLGANVELTKHYADHHRFTERELTTFIGRCVRRNVDAVITTEKDAVRFPRMKNVEIPIYFLRVEIEILTGRESWQHCVDRICKDGPLVPPEKFFS